MYDLFKLIDISQNTDQTTGEIRTYLNAVPAKPSQARMNLTIKNADTINQLQSLVGKTVMLPIEHGVFDGRPFIRLLDDPIMQAAPLNGTSAASKPK